MIITDVLRQSGLESTDAELIAAHAYGKDRTWIIGHARDKFDPAELERFHTFVERRKKGEPVALIVGHKEFFGRSFCVTQDTLIPRPATEERVQTALDVLAGKKVETIRLIDTEIVAWIILKSEMENVKLVIDIGTGSGCIAITLACERPDLHVVATDISEEALIIARENAETLNAADRIMFKNGSGLAAAEPIDQPFLLVSNPPYIPENVKLDRDVRDFEPHAALFSGEEGTDVLHPLVQDALKHPLCRGFIVECRVEQVLKDLSPT